MNTLALRFGRLLLGLSLAFALLAFVALPIAAAAIGPALIRSAGLSSSDLSVSLSTGPALLIGRVDALAARSGPLSVEGRFAAADAQITLRDVSLPDHTFGSLDISSSDITATFASGQIVTARSLVASGPAADVTATAHFSAADLTAILGQPGTADRLGFSATSVQLGNGAIVLGTSTGDILVRLAIAPSGDLLLQRAGLPDRVLWAAVGSDAQDWRLVSVSVDPDGLTLVAHFDVAAFLARYPSLGDLVSGFSPAH